MDKSIIYIHGKGGTAAEAEHYKPLFPEADVIGFAYKSQTPWRAAEEFCEFFAPIFEKYSSVAIVANSVGAFFAMSALRDFPLEKAFFISPVADMEKLITDMMAWTGVSEEELRQKGEIDTDFGETLSWQYLCYVREHPIDWKIPTHILYGAKDNLTSFDTISRFAEKTGASLTVMPGGEHWFHTEEQMDFLDKWLIDATKKVNKYISGAVRQFSYRFAHGTLGGGILQGIDYLGETLKEESSFAEQAFAIFINNLEIHREKGVLNYRYCENRAARYIRRYFDPSYTPSPPFRWRELELYPVSKEHYSK